MINSIDNPGMGTDLERRRSDRKVSDTRRSKSIEKNTAYENAGKDSRDLHFL